MVIMKERADSLYTIQWNLIKILTNMFDFHGPKCDHLHIQYAFLSYYWKILCPYWKGFLCIGLTWKYYRNLTFFPSHHMFLLSTTCSENTEEL